MSDAVRERIEVLQHKRRQSEARGVLSAISDKLGEGHYAPVDANVSHQVQCRLYEKLRTMRASGLVKSVSFPDVNAAVDEFMERSSQLAADAMFEFYVGARGSGFFRGLLSRAFVTSCLQLGYEGMALVEPDLDSAVVLDVALDDPVRGDFYEIEWW